MIRESQLDSVLSVGKPWPPTSEEARLKRYDENEKLFQGRHSEVFLFLLKLFSDHEAEHNKVLFILNWYKRLSTLWADLLVGEQPHASAGTDPEAPPQLYLDDFIERTSYWKLQHTRAIDVSRFGHGIVEAYYDSGCKLQVVHPSKYFPLIDGEGRISAHMIAWLDETEFVDHIRQQTLKVRIHRAGEIENREYTVQSGRVSAGPAAVSVQETGVDQPLVFVVHNLQTSSDTFGIDDYGDIDPIIKRLESTFTRSGRTLDVHSEPVFMVPQEAIARDPYTGAVFYDSKKKIFPLTEGSASPQYITWDGQLTAAFGLIDKAMDQFYALSETCRAAFEPDKVGNQLSGTALRMLMATPLKKVDRLKLNYDPICKQELKVFTAFEKARGYDGAEPLDSVSIVWQDGLPDDFTEAVANVVALKSQNLIWDEMALRMLYKLEGKALQDALAKLQSSEPKSEKSDQPFRIQLPEA